MALSLKISLDGGKMVKTMQFDPSTTVYDACRLIREKNPDTCVGELKDYGLFLISNEEAKKGIWLEPSRNLDYYILRNGDVLEYNKKIRNLRVRMLDGTVKTLLVDDSQVVANLMVVICTKIGITNYDEYGLVREEVKEEPDPCDKPNYGTLTLKRRHQDKERDVKMDQLRKKLHTDDEVNWVEGGKTLREQGIEVGETLLLRRKLFYSDRNVDSRDPVQLALLYVQARDAILDGTHPVTQQRACEFAGIQCQIQFGDHKEDKHTTGFLDLKEFLPSSYVKVKGIEKKVFREHRKHIGLSELDAKVLYTKSARALNTYGVAFFLVKEKMKGKNKLVPRLLGVTKDSVLRLDEKTKETLQSWPLTTVRRWCASPNTFTLDFGDYSDQYYSVQTTEAEQILQVIAGYIDIILKRQRAKDHLGIEGDEGSAMVEDSVSPSKANIIQHDTLKSGKAVNTECVAQPGVLRQPAEDQKSYAMSHLTGAQQTTVSGVALTTHTSPAAGQMKQTRVTSVLSEPQRALLSTISSGRQIIKHTESDLQRAQLPELGADAGSMKWKQVTMDTNRQVVTSHIAAMNAATAQVVTLTSGPTEEVDHTAVGAAITTITSNLPEMTKGVQMIAALMDDTDNGDRLLDATRKLCSAFTDLLKAAEPETKEPRQSLLNAASRVGEASTSVLHTIGEETPYDKETQDILLSLAKAVANTTAALVLKAKQAAAHCKEDAPAQAEIIAAATHCALATSQLVACTKVVAGTLQSPACREQLSGAVRLVRVAVERLLTASASSPSSPQLAEAAQAVIDALQTLLDHASRAEGRGVFPQSSVEGVLSASERVLSAGDGAEMVHHARMLGQATAHLIAGIKTEAEQQPSETQRKLLAAAKLLADATAKMVEAARQCASSPQDVSKQETLRRAAEELRYITVDYAQGQDIVGAQLDRLQDAAKQAASSATQLLTAAQNASVHNTNKYSQETLLSECGPLQDAIPGVVRAVNVYSANHAAPAAQLDLITASETFLQAASDVSSSARGVLPTVTDGASAKLLADNTHRFNDSCTELRSAVTRARISCKDVELDAALDIISSLQKELDEVEQAARNCQLTPLPGQNAEYAWSTMRAGQRSVSSMSAQLVSRVGREGSAAAGMAGALTHYIAGVTAAVNIYPDYHRLISTSRHVLESSQLLVETVKTYMAKPETVDVNRLHTIANNINKSMEASVEAIPSHRELDHVTENINETLNILNMGDFPQTDRTYSSLQEELKQAAEQLSTSAQNVSGTAIRQQHPELVSAAQQYGTHFNTLLGCCVDIVGLQENRDNRDRMVTCMKSVTVNSSKLLTTAKSVSQDISRPNVKNELASAARAVTDSINELLDACSLAAPGQRECDRAVMRLRAMSSMLEEATEPLNNLGYFACLDAVVDQSKGLSEGMSSMASTVKRSSHEQFANAINTAADNICGLVEATAQAAYLVGVSDSSSTVGRAGLVDQAQFSRAAAAIEQACAQLSSPTSSQQSVLSAATVIAKHTSALCNSCRVASSRTAQTQPKRHFVQAAKDVANSTAALVKEIKALDQDYCEANRVRCAEATIPLRQAVSGLCQFADSPQFAAVPAKISPQARRGQESILECGRSIISASCSMIESAKALSVQPTDKAQWQALATHSKTVSDSIKSLVNNIREKAPGQKECAAALDTVSGQQRALDAAALAAISNTLQPHKYHTLQGYTEQIESSATEMLDRVEPLRNAAKREAENLGHAVLQIVSYVEPLVAATIGAASNITESKSQADLIDKTKTVLESLSLFIQASKHAAGNPRATGAHPEVESSAADVSSALSELLDHSRELVSHLGQVGGLVDCVGRSIMRLTQHRMSLVGTYDESDSFVDYQTRMVANAKEIARLATDMCAASTSSSQCEKLSPLSSELVRKYELLSHDAVGAAATTAVSDVPTRLRSCVAELGESCQHIIRECAQCRVSHSVDTQRRVADAAADVGEKVVSVLSALQAGSKGTQACIDGAAKIAAIIGDLETTILFASAGTLQSESEHSSFSDHRESILKTAKRLVEDTKTLVGGAAGSQQQLAEAAQSATNTIVALAEVSKTGAASLGSSNPELQVMLLHAARDVAAALRDLAHATKGASGKHVAHPDMDTLKQTAKRLKDTKRRSLPTTNSSQQKQNRRNSSYVASKENSCDSETDLFVSDQEDELLKLLDYSSQDDDVSPSVFYDNCEDVIAYIESHMLHPTPHEKDDDLNSRYNTAARNSILNMDWRVLKYGENILLGEIKELVDLVIDATKTIDAKHNDEVKLRVRANKDLESEMKRLSRVIEDLDAEIVPQNDIVKEVTIRTMRTSIPTKRLKLDERLQRAKLRNPIFKVKKVRPVNLIVNLDINGNKTANIKPVEPETPEQTQKSEPNTVVVEPEVITKDNSKSEFWKMFTDDTDVWKALAERNLDKMEETRRDLAAFSGHELNVDYDQLNRYTKEKQTLQSFIDEVDKSKSINKHLEYDEKYEEMVLRLIAFAKKDFLYKGFDPLIDRLNSLSNVRFERKKMNERDIINIRTHVDVTEYTYEELCSLEKYYKEIIDKYKNGPTVERPSRETKSASPTYHRNVILNVRSSDDTKRRIDKYTGSLNRRSERHESENNVEIFDLTRTYPLEYYANNWWRIYEDVLRSREEQYGSIENWWKFYEEILRGDATDDPELGRLRSVVDYRNCKRRSRPNSRVEEQLKMLEDVDNGRFRESVDVSCQRDESVMVTNVTSLLKTVKAVEDEHTRGVRALESTIEAIQQEIGVLLSPGAPSHSSTAEELVRAARGLTSATATAVSAVSADGQQDQLVAAANRGRRSVVDLLHACKGAAYSACSDSPQSRDRVLHSGAAAAERYGALLSGVLEAVATPAAKERLPALCRAVAAATADLIAVVDIIKGSDWVDPEDPTVIAEHELLGAAASIDAAAKKLDALRPRQTIKVQEADESLNFDEMILEAAKSIIAASSALVKAASASQRELIDQGKVARRPASSSDDGQWSEGLVSAARLVAAAAHSLAESANSLVTGAGSEERLVSAARQVASSTAQLLVACKVKADPSSESTRRLQAAGAQVIRSTDNLVSAAKDSIRHEDERSLVLNRRMVGGIAQEIDARSEVLRIEKELEEARGRLSAIRQAKYRLKTGDTSGDDTDTDLCVGYTSDSSTQHRFKPTTLNNSSFLINTTYTPNSTYSQNNTTQSIQQLNQSIHGYAQPKTPQSYNQTTQLYNQTPQSYNQTPQSYNQTTQSYNQTTQSYGQSPQPYIQTPQSYNQSHIESQQSQSNYSTINKSYNGTFAPKSSQTSTFSSFKPQQEENKNYEGFTSRYETRLYDTPRPLHDYCDTEEQRRYESAFRTDTPLSPKFNARQLKLDEPKFDYKRDGVGQNFSETRRSTEAIPGGTKHSEYTIKSESYSSHPNAEVKITTSTPKQVNTNDLVKIATPDSDRTTSPYGGPNYMQETTTELKEIPNGTQKVTTTKIYSSSPVTLTSTDTKYEPVKLEGIDELSKSFDDESRFSTLDSKLSSDTSRSFMRPSDFHTEYQSVTKVSKPGELMKEIDNMGKKFSQQTIKSETIERKSVMTSSHKSETQSTVTKKFGNF